MIHYLLRRPWWYLVTAAIAVLFITSVSVDGPRYSLVDVKSTAMEKLCNDRSTPPEIPVHYNYANYQLGSERHYSSRTNYTLSDKPATRVIGLIFAGRRRYLEILHCYLQRNLMSNGGWLDEIRLVIKTTDEADIAYIKQLVRDTPGYSYVVGAHYREAYLNLERDAIYVKIDDDVVFMEDSVIPAIVTRVYNNPQYSLVSANVMNQPALAFVHYHLGAIHPYLPELDRPVNHDAEKPVQDWRLSKNPLWHGDVRGGVKDDYESVYKNHRWLRLSRDSDVTKTPIGRLGHEGNEYKAFNAALTSWSIAAQEHYSFFENLEKDQLWRYKFDMWHYFYERVSINFIAFHATLVLDHPVPESVDDDEEYISVTLPKMLERPAVLDGSGMVVHFGFGGQTEKLSETDLLGRYKRFSQENICGRPWGQSWVLGAH